MSFIQSEQRQPELIVKLKKRHLFAAGLSGSAELSRVIQQRGARLLPVAPRRAGLLARIFGSRPQGELSQYFHVDGRSEDLEQLRHELSGLGSVETAYIKPPAEPAMPRLARPTPSPVAKVGATPDFTSRQGYLAPAPLGIDAGFAWTLPGGKGDGVRVIDCEWSWNFSHEDLAQQCDGVVEGTMDPADDTNHGTCVAGVIVANENGIGITGTAPLARLGGAVLTVNQSQATSAVIARAADLLSTGDIILLEVHRSGPNAPEPRQGQKGYIAIEWWPDDYAAITYAASRGIIVVEAAGNGGENLDDPMYDIPDPDFPVGWTNPFSASSPPSAAIIVGAGMPPSGTHGRSKDEHWGFGDIYMERARCSFSNYGQRIDCQGWGYEVTSLGLGDLYDSGPNHQYTDVFAGTSSAIPIVAGTVACLLGAMRGAGKQPISPDSLRQLFRTTGSQQQGDVSQRIGNLPDLRALVEACL